MYQLHLSDCLQVMSEMPDKSIDAVVTDPPYGIRADETRTQTGGKHGWRLFNETAWDKERPSRQYFDEMIRISRYQIIWGGNYFADLLPPSMGWLIWDKGQRNFSLADVEMAWTSIWVAARAIDYPRSKANQEERLHPTQKPVQVMSWCVAWLDKYGKDIKTIFDPFMGSGSTALACIQHGKMFIGAEINGDYFAVAQQRIEAATQQLRMFP